MREFWPPLPFNPYSDFYDAMPDRNGEVWAPEKCTAATSYATIQKQAAGASIRCQSRFRTTDEPGSIIRPIRFRSGSSTAAAGTLCAYNR